jgi:peptidyl-prolyl cis-trans isomerase D
LIRVEHVTKPAPPEADQQQAFARQLQQWVAQEELSAYLAGVRKRYDVSVSNENLEK